MQVHPGKVQALRASMKCILYATGSWLQWSPSMEFHWAHREESSRISSSMY